MGTNSFQDLTVWQEAHKLVLSIYKLSKQFPKDEQFALTNQIRRAAVSITSNLAEGYGRKTSKDKENFYIMARGSLDEVRNQILIARDLGYIDRSKIIAIEEQTDVVGKLLSGLLRAHRNSNF